MYIILPNNADSNIFYQPSLMDPAHKNVLSNKQDPSIIRLLLISVYSSMQFYCSD